MAMAPKVLVLVAMALAYAGVANAAAACVATMTLAGNAADADAQALVDAINNSKTGSGFDQLFASIAQKFPGLPFYPGDGQSITGASKVGAEASLVTTFSYPNLNEQQNVKTAEGFLEALRVNGNQLTAAQFQEGLNKYGVGGKTDWFVQTFEQTVSSAALLRVGAAAVGAAVAGMALVLLA